MVSVIASQESALCQPRVANLRQRLSNIENTLSAIERTNQIDDLNAQAAMEVDFDRAAAEANAAFTEAMQQAQALAQRQGVTAAQFAFLQQLDTDLKAEQVRAETIVRRMGDIDGRIRSGAIKLAPAAINQLSPQELREFRRSLTPATDRDYRQRMPTKFTGVVQHLSQEEWAATRHCGLCEVGGSAYAIREQEGRRSLLAQVMDALVPPVHAALGIGCYGICVGSLGTACITCVISAGGAAATAYATYRSCKGSCCRCKWYKPWCCACRGACLVAFLAALA
jgi:hypothetical protein